jgi:uncharacterized membrane protein YqjE
MKNVFVALSAYFLNGIAIIIPGLKDAGGLYFWIGYISVILALGIIFGEWAVYKSKAEDIKKSIRLR